MFLRAPPPPLTNANFIINLVFVYCAKFLENLRLRPILILILCLANNDKTTSDRSLVSVGS